MLTVCAALEDVAHGHDPRQAGRPGGGHNAPDRLSATAAMARSICRRETDGGPVAMYVGNLEHYQGIDLLLEGFRHTLDAVPEAQLVIVGGRKNDIARYGAAPHRWVSPAGTLSRSPADQRAREPAPARPTSWCRPGSRASTPR